MYMSVWNVTEARARLPEILRRVDAGDEVTLTLHGRAVAVIVRPDSLRTRRASSAKQAAEELGSLIDDLTAEPAPSGHLTVDRAEDLVATVRAARDRS